MRMLLLNARRRQDCNAMASWLCARRRPMQLARLLAGLAVLLLSACTGVPEGLKPVGGFEVRRYLGQWYEIARFDHRFERGLTDVSATYSLREDGGINVVNRGYDRKRGKWQEASGRAYFLGSPHTGSLKVSFFGPFYGGYHVIALDREAYRYAVVSGPSRDYLWILARERQLPEPLLKSLVAQARQAGFDTSQLIYVAHTR
jgi:apolipoprotein D and lipocalin family protein